MGDSWDDNGSSSRRYDRSFDHRREERRGRGSQFYRRSNRFGNNWSSNSNTQNYNNDSYGKSNYDNNGSDGTNGLVMYIDTNSIGRLIGRGGSKIKALQDESSAMINIDKRSERDGQTAVTLTGSDEAQQRAKSLIEELLTDRSYTQGNVKSAHRIEAQPEQVQDIDWSNFDWSKANEEYEERQKQKWATLPPIIKNFYKEDPVVANMSKEKVAHFRRINNNIEVRRVFENEGGSNEEIKIPNPVETFEQAFHVI